MIREEMTRNGFTDRTVRKYLPAEAKMLSKVRQSGEFAAHNSANLDLLGLNLDSNYTQLTKEQLSKFRKTRLIEIIEKLHNLLVVIIIIIITIMLTNQSVFVSISIRNQNQNCRIRINPIAAITDGFLTRK